MAEFQAEFRDLLPEEYRKIIAKSNGISITVPEHHCNYKYYLGKGNNGAMISRILSRRGCWTKTDTKENANFVWTQGRDREFLNSLKKCKRVPNIEIPSGPTFHPLNRRVGKNQIEKELKKYGLHLITDSFQFRIMEITTS